MNKARERVNNGGIEMKVYNISRARQEQMEKNGWILKTAEFNELPEELHSRLSKEGYSQVKVYYEGTRVRGIHRFYAFVKH